MRFDQLHQLPIRPSAFLFRFLSSLVVLVVVDSSWLSAKVRRLDEDGPKSRHVVTARFVTASGLAEPRFMLILTSG